MTAAPPDGLGFMACRYLDLCRAHAAAVQRAELAEAAVGRVQTVLDHAAKVSPSEAMTVYAREIRDALDDSKGRALL